MTPEGKGSVLRTRVHAVLRERIVSGDLPPGASLGEVQLAAELQVSRTPLREALHQLAEEGFAEYAPHRGARVVRPTPRLVTDVFQIREALEGLAAREAAKAIEAARVAQLRRDFERLRPAVNSGDYAEVGDFLHAAILEACGNERLERLMQVSMSQIRWFQMMAARVPGQLLQAFREHESLLSALESRDGDWAETSARAHVRNTLQALLRDLPRAGSEDRPRRAARRAGSATLGDDGRSLR